MLAIHFNHHISAHRYLKPANVSGIRGSLKASLSGGAILDDSVNIGSALAVQLKLEEGRQMVLEINRSKWLEAGPALITTYFGLTHIAFALIGLAFLKFG
jgi:hypothetical protein